MNIPIFFSVFCHGGRFENGPGGGGGGGVHHKRSVLTF